METGLAKVTIAAPRRRLDVALPEHVPLAELLPEVLRHAGAGLADEGERHGGWVLRRGDGVALATGLGLQAQGVRDGDILHLVPAHDDWPRLEFDDVAEAVADGARRRGGTWTSADTRAATLAAAAVPLALGLPALLTAGPGAAPTGLGVAALLTLTATITSRRYGHRTAAVALGGCALPYAFAGGATLVAASAQTGVLPALPWLGGPSLLTGSLAVALTAVLAGPGVAAGSRVFTAGATIGLLTALAALLPEAAGGAAALVSVLVCGIGVLPPLAIRLGRMPLPPLTVPDHQGNAATTRDPIGRAPLSGSSGPDLGRSADPARERPGRAAIGSAVARTDEFLTGMLIGYAVLAVGAFIVLAGADTVAARILTGVSAVALLLRARLFITTRQRTPLIGAGLAGLLVLGADLLTEGLPRDARWLLALIAAAVVLALATVTFGATYAERPPSPYWGRAADLLEAATVISIIPVACAVAGLYTAVSGLT